MKSTRFARATAAAATSLALMFGGTSIASAHDADSGASGRDTAVGSRSAARAATCSVGISRIAATSIVVTSMIQTVRVGADFAGGAVTAHSAANVVRGSKLYKRVAINPFSPRRSFTFATTYGRGTFRIGPTRVTGSCADHSTFNFVDRTYGHFTAKSGLRGGFKHARVYKIRRSGSRHVVSVNLKRYVTKGKWKGYSKKIALQQKNGGWKTLKTLRLKKGRKTYAFNTSSTRKYRLTIGATSTTIGGRSQVIKI